MALTLRFATDGEIHCDTCYEPFLLPLSIIGAVFGERVLCSTCACQLRLSARMKRLAEEHQPELGLAAPICECGLSLDRCHAENCQPWSAKTVRQGRLF